MRYRILYCLLLLAGPSLAEVAVIVNPANNASLTESEISRLYLGKAKSFPDGAAAVPLNLAPGSAVREQFEKSVLKKSSSQIKAYWSKLVFTGKGTPPQEVASDAEIIAIVKSDPKSIGYVDAGAVTGDVKVIAKF